MSYVAETGIWPSEPDGGDEGLHAAESSLECSPASSALAVTLGVAILARIERN